MISNRLILQLTLLLSPSVVFVLQLFAVIKGGLINVSDNIYLVIGLSNLIGFLWISFEIYQFIVAEQAEEKAFVIKNRHGIKGKFKR